MDDTHKNFRFSLSCILGFILIFLTGSCSISSSDCQYDQLLSEYTVNAVLIDQREFTNLFLEKEQLKREELILGVLDRNPNVASARYAWQASIERYPQAIALEDPVLSYTFAPGSLGDKTFNNMPLRYGQTIELSQKLPFPGKRTLQGSMAITDAQKMQGDFELVKLDLVLNASMLFDDYYLIQKAIEVNNYHLTALNHSKFNAENLYVTGAIGEQDWLQVSLEIDQILHEKAELESQRKIIIARINGLLHRDSVSTLPPPPEELPLPDIDLDKVEQWESEALQHRPDVQSILAQIEGSNAAIELAELQYFPDFDVKASYDSLWDQPQYRPQIGVSMNIPFIQFEKRKSAINEATLNKKRLESEYALLKDKIRLEIEEALQGVIQNQRIVQIWEENGLPLAKEKFASATFNYESGQGSLMAILEADRNLRTIELRLFNALAFCWKQKAQLDRAIGRLPNYYPSLDE